MWKRELGWKVDNRLPSADDRDEVIEFYQRHSHLVKSSPFATRTLIFDVRQGWEPLCDFLNKPIPEIPFPNRSSRQEFRSRLFIFTAIDVCGSLALVLFGLAALRFIVSMCIRKSKVKRS